MKRNLIFILFICILMTFFSTAVFALNPFVTHIYTADPSAHVFENRVYVYPSHDKDNPGWFDMQDYHVFSSADMINWVDHGVILKKEDVKWTDGYFWAPDCAYKNGKYYLYFPAHIKGQPAVQGSNKNMPYIWGIGVAIGNSPAGPFVPLDSYIKGSFSVDPCVFVDDNGDAYIVFGGQGAGGRGDNQGPLLAKLNPNMTAFTIDSNGNPIINQIPYDQVNNWFEASWIHKRNGNYYLSYSTGEHTSPPSEIHYAMSNSITGTWVSKGVVIDTQKNDTIGLPIQDSWTIHQSFVEFKGEWYAFYHHAEMSLGNTMKRSICFDKLHYNNNETMQLVSKTREGPFGTSAYSRIKAMFFSAVGSNVDKSKVVSEDAGGGDIGKSVGWMKNGDQLLYINLDFGSIKPTGFSAEIATGNNSGGYIDVIIGNTTIGTLRVNNSTGGWHNWTTASCPINADDNFKKTQFHQIALFFHTNNSSDTYTLNLNSFKFTYDGAVIPIGYPVALKSNNPNCIDNNEVIDDSVNNENYKGLSQKYLCADKWQNYDLCANRNDVGKENKFSILNRWKLNIAQGGFISSLIQLNSSSNGKNLTLVNVPDPINASGGDFKSSNISDYFSWEVNDDNSIHLQQGYLMLIDTWQKSNDPAKAYCTSQDPSGDWEKFYCEVQDAPIGCTVAFKTLGHFKKRNGDTDYTDLGQMYLCADTWNMDALCASRSEIGNDDQRGEWEKFLIVDAKNGYIALKSFNKDAGNQYLRVDTSDKICKIKIGGNTIDSDYERFQWINNGDGTISLRNIGANQILSVVNVDASGNLTNPAKVYANKSKVSYEPDSHEKFYCQIVSPAKN